MILKDKADNINFTIKSSRDKFWEEENQRDYGLPRIPPNFNCEEFYKVEHAKTADETGNAYKKILCDLSSTSVVNAKCEADILTLQEECKVIKSRWARTLERLYIRLNFNLGEEDNFIETYKYVSAGADHSCAVNSEDEVLCFGDNTARSTWTKRIWKDLVMQTMQVMCCYRLCPMEKVILNILFVSEIP